MISNIFVNLPVKDLAKTKMFFSKLGFSFNDQFTDDTAAAMVIGKNIYAMLLTMAKFRSFTKKTVINAHKSVEVLLALSTESKDKVNEFMDKVLTAGGVEVNEAQDYGFMYERSFEDLDGHIWSIFWMDPNHVRK